MQALSKTRTVLVVALMIPALAACETPTSAPLTEAGALAAFKPLRASASDTCDTQRQVAEHNGRFDTIKQGKVVVYKAACDVDPKAKPQRVAGR